MKFYKSFLYTTFMASSPNFIQAKKLIYEQGFEIDSLEINISPIKDGQKGECTGKAKITFNKNDEIISLEGDDSDFFELACKLKTTFRDGRKKIIDISKLPVKNTGTYYENMNYFIPKNSDEITHAIKRLQLGTTNIPSEFNISKGVEDCINKNFESKEAKLLLDNYFDSIAAVILGMIPIQKGFENVKKKMISNENRFNIYFNKINEIFQDKLMKLSLLESFEKICNECNVDVYFMLKNFTQTIKLADQNWGSLFKQTGGTLPGEEGMQRLIDDYSKLYEIIRESLRDLAYLLKDTTDYVDLNSQEGVIQFLKNKGYSDIFGTINTNLRNGGTHISIDYSTKGKVYVYDSSSKKRQLLDSLSYQKIIDKHYRIRELSLAITFSYLMVEQILLLRILDSPEFKFYVVENKKPSS